LGENEEFSSGYVLHLMTRCGSATLLLLLRSVVFSWGGRRRVVFITTCNAVATWASINVTIWQLPAYEVCSGLSLAPHANLETWSIPVFFGMMNLLPQ
jgi:hypothetical protein